MNLQGKRQQFFLQVCPKNGISQYSPYNPFLGCDGQTTNPTPTHSSWIISKHADWCVVGKGPRVDKTKGPARMKKAISGKVTWYSLNVSKNRCTPKSSILMGFSIINHPFWGTPIFGNTPLLRTSIRNNFDKRTAGQISRRPQPSRCECSHPYRVLKGPGGVPGEGVFLGNPTDSGREDCGTL